MKKKKALNTKIGQSTHPGDLQLIGNKLNSEMVHKTHALTTYIQNEVFFLSANLGFVMDIVDILHKYPENNCITTTAFSLMTDTEIHFVHCILLVHISKTIVGLKSTP